MNRVDVYQDKQNLFWVWCDLTQSNLCVKAKTELDAYKQALDHCVFVASLYKERRDSAESKLDILTKAFESIGGKDDD